jgi:hypothetical protein
MKYIKEKTLMEKLGKLAQQYWFIIVGGIGVLLILGAVFNWKWAVQHEGDRPLGFMSFIYNLFGASGYRIATGILGGIILILTIVYALLLKKL